MSVKTEMCAVNARPSELDVVKTGRPLVSFCLFAFNQEEVVREAVEAAFAQTYAPIEFVLSDDCSSDKTYSLLQDAATSREGVVSITLNRNATNLGVVAHYNRVCQLARGQLLVFAAADDLSRPERVSRIVETWERAGRPREAAFYSKVQRITPAGEPYPREGELFGHAQPTDPAALIAEWGGFVIGATLAVTRGLLERFGPLLPSMPCEDIPTLWRGAMAGHLHFIDAPLVLWRVGGTGLWSHVYGETATPAQRKARMAQFLNERLSLLTQAEADVEACSHDKRMSWALMHARAELRFMVRSRDGSSWLLLAESLLLMVRRGRVSHALRSCVAERIRIAKGEGKGRFLCLLTDALAASSRLFRKWGSRDLLLYLL